MTGKNFNFEDIMQNAMRFPNSNINMDTLAIVEAFKVLLEKSDKAIRKHDDAINDIFTNLPDEDYTDNPHRSIAIGLKSYLSAIEVNCDDIAVPKLSFNDNTSAANDENEYIEKLHICINTMKAKYNIWVKEQYETIVQEFTKKIEAISAKSG